MNFPETLDDLAELEAEIKRKGFRVRYLDPNLGVDYLYFPSVGQDGLEEKAAPDLLRRFNIVAKYKSWTDITLVGPDLAPVEQIQLDQSSVIPLGGRGAGETTYIKQQRQTLPPEDKVYPHPFGSTGNDEVDAILAAGKYGEVAPPSPVVEEDILTPLATRVARAYGVSAAKLIRYAIEEDVDGAENLGAALEEIAKSLQAAG